jgi:shikimate kinase / 3-dehydroquinate synthase
MAVLNEPNVILTGCMGTGKTSVGRAIAEQLGRSFVDTDAWIEERAGKTVSMIFAEEGEDRFRAWEAKACAALSEPRGLVIATGGWTLGPLQNRSAIERGGRVICLAADAEVILSRLKSTTDRPLLVGDDRESKLRALLKEREALYRSFAWQVDTTHLSVLEAAQVTLALWNAIDRVDEPDVFYLLMSERGTSILLGSGLVAAIGSILPARGLMGRAILVTDSNVGSLHGERIAHSLAIAGFESVTLSVPAGEESKSIESITRLYAGFAQARVERDDVIVALGGGMIGDLTGFAAATYLRGMRWACVPTSLLAMVDASIGGKVGVDLPEGKNLVGAFHPPIMTISDIELLSTLSKREYRSGLAEVIKAGLIADPELFVMIEHGQDDLRDMLRRALKVKIDIVRADPFERGRRAALNLGHTIGHGIEAASKYTLRHGEAIAIGLVAEAKIAERIGLATAGLSNRIEQVLDRVGLPTRCDLDPDSIMALMRSDKKRQAGRLKFALPRGIGDVVIGIDVDDAAVSDVLTTMQVNETETT